MNITIKNRKIRGMLKAPLYAPPVHRYMICQALTDGHEPVICNDPSRELMSTLGCLIELGLEGGDLWERAADMSRQIFRLHCKDSAGTFRLMLPVAAALGRNCEFEIDEKVLEQPVSQLLKTLKVHGIRHEFVNTRSVRIWGKLTAGTFIISSEIDPQFISGLLMALPLLSENSVIMIDGAIRDLSEIQMTLDILNEAGISVETRINESTEAGGEKAGPSRSRSFIGAVFKIAGKQKYQMIKMPEAEGDWTAAAYFLTAGAICAGPVTLSGLRMDTAQKTKKILDILKMTGTQIEYGLQASAENKKGLFRPARSKVIDSVIYTDDEEHAVYVRATGPWADPSDLSQFFTREHLKAFDTDVSDIPELIPALSLLACAARGTSCLRNARCPGQEINNVFQTPDRIEKLIDLLESMGIMIWETEGDIYIEGYAGVSPLSGGTVVCGDDALLAMMGGIASCISSAPVVIEDAESIEQMYPDFYMDLIRLQTEKTP